MFYVALASSEALFWSGARGRIPVTLNGRCCIMWVLQVAWAPTVSCYADGFFLAFLITKSHVSLFENKYGINPILPGLLNTLRTWGGGGGGRILPCS